MLSHATIPAMPRLRGPIFALLLVACTSAQDPATTAARATPGPAATSEPAATLEPAATREPEATPTPEPAISPTPAPSETRWHCLCYRRTIAGGEEPVTACRSTRDACTGLEARARAGGRGIVARSVMRACQEVRADHPGDLLGTRERWAASKVPGAWLSTGECLLAAGSPAEDEPRSDADEEAAGLAAEAAAERFYAGERIGGISIGMTSRALIQELGAPTRKSGREFAEYSGGYEERWEWAGKGLAVTMGSDDKRGPQSVLMVVIDAPSELKTQRGVGLGESADRVRKLYADVKAAESDDEIADEVFVAGSIYGGLFFMFEAGKVQTIVLGPSAE